VAAIRKQDLVNANATNHLSISGDIVSLAFGELEIAELTHFGFLSFKCVTPKAIIGFRGVFS
jgi:hypothetical protein